MLENRERIEKPSYHGAPYNWENKYFNERVQQFRKAHLEFDEFLNELDQLLVIEENEDFYNIIRFIDGDAEPNWVNTSNSLFDILIKLYNLCLSPIQALEYIKSCHEMYMRMRKCNYSVAKEFFVGEQEVEVDMLPDNSAFDRETDPFWFNVRIRPYRWNVKVAGRNKGVEFIAARYIQEDALMLFEYHQSEDLLTSITNKAIEQLVDNKVLTIERITQHMTRYRINLPAGRYDLSKL